MVLHPYMAVTITVRVLTLTLTTAILIVILMQLRRDVVSRAFINLIGIFAFNTAVAVFIRFNSLAGMDISFSFKLIIVSAAAIPAMTFIFVATYLDAWTPFRRRVAWFMLFYIVLSSFCAGMDWLNYDVHIVMPEGTLEFGRRPLANALVALGELLIGVVLFVMAQEFHKRRHGDRQHSGQILTGAFIILMAGVTISYPPLSRYTVEQFLYAAGTIVLTGPILRHRLFDPLTQLNTRLAQRAEQFAAITRVSQQAIAHLKLEELLAAVVEQIHAAFACYAVALYLPNEGRLVVRAAAGEASAAFLGSQDSRVLDESAHEPRIVRDARRHPEWQHPLHPGATAVARIPLRAPGQDNTLVGVLDIKREAHRDFSEDDVEVLNILANQLGIAIRNAELFEQVQRSDTSKSHFIHTLSHELRTPLQTVMSHVAFAKISKDYLAEIAAAEEALHHLYSLLKGILDIGKIEAGQVELVKTNLDPVGVLRQVEATFAGTLRDGVQLVRAYVDTLPPVYADEILLRQILGNLVSNACKFTEAGQITLDAHVDGTKLVFSVADTGPGIPPEVQSGLFTNFFQGPGFISRAYGGSGLGLTICRELVKLHGGEVWFESAEGRGTTFYCTIPLALETLATAHNADSPHVTLFPPPAHVPVQVLVIGLPQGRPMYMDADFDPTRPYRVSQIDSPEAGLRIARAMRPMLVVCAGGAAPAHTQVAQALAHLSEVSVIVCPSPDWQSVVETYFPVQKESM